MQQPKLCSCSPVYHVFVYGVFEQWFIVPAVYGGESGKVDLLMEV